MRVLHFMPVYKPAWRYGGPVRSVSQLCEGLAAHGVQVSVLTTNADGDKVLDVPVNQPVEMDGVTVRYFERIQTPWGIDSFALRQAIPAAVGEADLVHMSAMWQPLGVPLGNAARRAGTPYVCSLRGGVNSWAWRNRQLKHHVYWRLFEQKLLRGAAALHVTCEMERQAALALGVGIGQDLITIANGIQAADYVRRSDLARAFRQKVDLPLDQKIILSLGRVHPKKGLDLFLKASAELLRCSDGWVYVVVGPDERGYRQQLVSLANELGIATQVRFYDLLEDHLRLGAYNAAEIFVLTSHNENFGMSVVEAMAASVPVLVSDQVGISREIAADDAGLVVPLESNTIRAALSQLMSNPETRRLYAQRGSAAVQRRYDIRAVTQEMIKAYHAVLDRGRRSQS